MQQYLDLLDDILANGVERGDRTGTGTISVFGRQVRFDLEEGFPLVTTKKIHFKSCVHELLWFLSGDTNTKYLTDNGVRIWNEWADENGDLGPIYGAQWRNWGPCADFVPSGDDKQIKANIFHFDQLGFIINQIKRDPFSRRHLVSAWNVMEIPKMNLPPCHYAYQFYVAEGKISCLCVMRSVDCFLGLPFDIADYALLLMMVGQITDLQPKDLVFQLGDTHIYSNHVDQVKLQLTREPLPLPTVTLNPEIKNIDDFGFDDIVLNNYKFHPHIKGDIAV